MMTLVIPVQPTDAILLMAVTGQPARLFVMTNSPV
jgi:hypothetical protein